MSRVYRIALILHTTPKEAMSLTAADFDGIWQEYIDMRTEEATGKRRPKLYEYEREALRNLRERCDA